MKIIFDHKQYDATAAALGGHIRTVTCFPIEINGIEWKVEPLGKESLEYQHRELNLNLLDDIIDDKNYEYCYYGKSCRYRYREGFLYLTFPNMDECTKMEMTFDEACDYVKRSDG